MKPTLMIIALIALIGCMRNPEPKPAPFAAPPLDNGLAEQEPDSCGAAALSGLLGQTEGMIRTVRMTHPSRVIPLGAIVTQEYNAQRVNFHLNEDGLIASIDCG